MSSHRFSRVLTQRLTNRSVAIDWPARYHEPMRSRTILWILALAAIFGFGWYKSCENRADRQRRAAWNQQMERLQAESQQEYRRLVAWLRTLHSQPGGRQQVIDEVPGGDELAFHEENGREVTSWTHPEYGIRIDFGFVGDRLVSHQANSGTGNLLTIQREPARIATSSRAERVRRFAAGWGGWLWLVCLVLAFAPRSYGLIAAEMMLLVTLACGVAWTVSPFYSITVQGILSNDPLFFAAIMFVISLIVLAMRVAPIAARSGRPQSLRFGMGTLLSIMAAVAVLSAMGPLGYFAMCVFAVGGVCFYGLLQTFTSARRDLSNVDVKRATVQQS